MTWEERLEQQRRRWIRLGQRVEAQIRVEWRNVQHYRREGKRCPPDAALGTAAYRTFANRSRDKLGYLLWIRRESRMVSKEMIGEEEKKP